MPRFNSKGMFFYSLSYGNNYVRFDVNTEFYDRINNYYGYYSICYKYDEFPKL